MARQTWYERLAAGLALITVGLVVSGTKACQEDYDLGSSTSVSGTATATPEEDGSDTATKTPAPSATRTAQARATATAIVDETPDDPAETDDPAAAESLTSDADLFTQLSKLSEPPTKGAKAGTADTNANWLGEGFDKDKKAQEAGSASDRCTDSDNDGFVDTLEIASGTDPNDPNGTPDAPTTRLADRLRGIDSDYDGLGDAEDPNPMDADTDKDGRLDGAEVLSGGNPRDANDTYPDADGDGLSDSFEKNRGTDPTSRDSDSDGLIDALEFAVGAQPQNCDTDNDGVLDGLEVTLFESDPTRGEQRKR